MFTHKKPRQRAETLAIGHASEGKALAGWMFSLQSLAHACAAA